jgi:uncharacterized protein YndB with AHSA1/START domain
VQEDTMPDITRSLDIKARPSEVWTWLSTQDGLRQWMLPDLEIDLRVGGSYRGTGPDGTTITGTVLEIIPEGALVLSWMEEGSSWVHPARLLIELRPTVVGTRAYLTHDGFAGIGTPTWQRTADAYRQGLDRHRILEALSDAVDG